MTEKAKKDAALLMRVVEAVLIVTITGVGLRSCTKIDELALGLAEMAGVISVIQTNVDHITKQAEGFIDLEKRVRGIESSRFTTADGIAIRAKMAEISGHLPSEFPPAEWKERVRGLEKRVRELEKQK